MKIILHLKMVKHIWYIKNILYYTGSISEKNVNLAISILEKNDISRINLSSHGGDVDSGLRLISYLQRKNQSIHIHVDGYAMSMAAVILGSAKFKTMGRNSFLMYHDIWGTVAGDYNSSDFSDQIYYHNFRLSLINDIINPKKDPKIKDFLDVSFSSRRDKYLTSSEALAFGLIDSVE